MKTEQKINKRVFYKEKVSLFREYAREYPDKELFPLFTEWADRNELYGVNRHEVWRRARKLRPPKLLVIQENSEEWVRLHAVLDILLEADLARFNKLLEKREQKAGREPAASREQKVLGA
jgi:hypothetical protein